MSFGNIRDYLLKFRDLAPPDNVVKETIVNVMKNEFGLDLSKNQINISRNIAYIQTSPGYKSAIYLRKKEILEEINIKSSAGIIDIR